MIDFGFVWLIKMFYMHSNFYLILRSRIGVIAPRIDLLNPGKLENGRNTMHRVNGFNVNAQSPIFDIIRMNASLISAQIVIGKA
jgi:hypothetical protein